LLLFEVSLFVQSLREKKTVNGSALTKHSRQECPFQGFVKKLPTPQAKIMKHCITKTVFGSKHA